MSSEPRPPDVPGYRVARLLGRGAHSSVWLARQESVDRDVALKIMPFARADDAARFAREVEASAKVQHPGVVACHDVGTCADGLFLALELLPGGDCEALVQRGGPLPEAQAMRILGDAARGLQGLADLRLVHRDIKPANLLLAADGQAQVGDLGLARWSGGGTSLSRNSLIEGTPGYMSPEQVRGEALDARSDLYALAASGVFLLTAKPPVGAATLPALLARIAGGPGPDLNALLPEISPDLRQCLAICLQHDRSRRYQRPADFAADLAAIALGQPPLVARRLRQEAAEASALRAAAPAPGRRGDPALWWFAAAALAISVLGGWVVGRPRPTDGATLAAARQAGTAAAWNAYRAGTPSASGRSEADAALAVLDRIRIREAENTAASREAQRLRDELRTTARELAQRLAAQDPELPAIEAAAAPVATNTGATNSGATNSGATSTAAAPVAGITATSPSSPQAAPAAPAGPAALGTAIAALPPPDPQAVARNAGHIPAALAQWVHIPDLGAHAANFAGVLVHPTDPDLLLVYSRYGAVWRSTDRGRSWQGAAAPGAKPSLSWAPAQWWPRSKQVFLPALGSDCFGLLSSDDGQTFTAVAPPPVRERTPQVYDFLEPARVLLSDGTLLGAVTDMGGKSWTASVHRSTDRGRSWKVATSGIAKPGMLLPGGDRPLLVDSGFPAQVSLDLGQTCKALPIDLQSNGPASAALPTGWLVVSSAHQIMHLARDGTGRHLGSVPAVLKGGSNGGPFDALAIAPDDPACWYAAAQDGSLLRTSDAGKTWRRSLLCGTFTSNDRLTRTALGITAGKAPTLVLVTTQRVLLLDLAGADRLFSEPVDGP